ncbi:MAG: 50S ribosomal protein L11, partial [Methanosphaera stadtmanae]|nr:50S ribosomal protein L11 [Methanosphaera stadtmanae]
MASQTIEILVEGGKATPGPPLGPAIGPLGIN